VPAREPRACAGSGVRAEGDRGPARNRPRLQDLVRQGQPHQRSAARGIGLEAGAADLCRDPLLARIARAHRRARARAMRRGGAGGRRAADPGLPVPADRSAAGGGGDRQGRQRQEGAVPGAVGHGQCRRQDHRRRQSQRAGHRARRLVRLQHAGVGHARAADHGAHDRRAGDFRRHPFGAAAGREGHLIGRRARIRAGAGARRGRGRRRRRVHRDPSRSRSCAVGRAQHGAAARIRGAGEDADGVRRARQERAR
jgi:hypothetical protein